MFPHIYEYGVTTWNKRLKTNCVSSFDKNDLQLLISDQMRNLLAEINDHSDSTRKPCAEIIFASFSLRFGSRNIANKTPCNQLSFDYCVICSKVNELSFTTWGRSMNSCLLLICGRAMKSCLLCEGVQWTLVYYVCKDQWTLVYSFMVLFI